MNRRSGQFSQVEPDRTRAQRLTFAEDFLLEHSFSGVDIVNIEISGSTGISPKERSESSQSYEFPS
jgi:hypothetical protein